MAGRLSSEQLVETGKRILSFLLVVYLIFLLSSAVYRNYLVRSHIGKLEGEIGGLKKENQRLVNLITYYQTTTFRELEAREKLGLKKPGETVIALPENSDEPLGSQPTTGSASQPSSSRPNYLKWWEYLFGG